VSAGAGNAAEDQPETTGTALFRGGMIGRYIVLGLLGKGGMGVVYSAYDPELDRKVALKLLRAPRRKGDDIDAKRTRLLREAKAIARLSHPNVIVVYDVGTYQDQVFIAMELIDGLTAMRWKTAKDPKWKEVLKVFIAAGEGIAAAHAADLIHRDFKPENVMVTAEGKVRVMDFGLARQLERVTEDSGPVEAPDTDGDTEPGIRPPESRLTNEGNVVGTPAYMPPEQYLGVTDERSDQFAFCVSLYECLYGQHPFEARTAFGLTGNVQAGRVHEAPAHTKVPVWLRKILLKGMKPRPEDRYDSMRALLDTLGRDPAVARRRWLAASAVVAGAAVLAFGVHRASDSRRAFCYAAPEKLAGAWELPGSRGATEGPRHVAVRRAFLATGKLYAQDAIRGVMALLDDYATKWAATYRDACEATHVRGEQSEEVLDLRMGCLNDRLSSLRALTDIYSNATGEVVEHAVDAAHALTPLDGCNDAKQLRSLIPSPDPAVRGRVEALRRELGQIKAIHDAGRYVAALDRLKPVVAEARSLGYRPLEAEALVLAGRTNAELARFAEAEKVLDEALRAALAAHHDDLLPEFAAWQIWAVEGQNRPAEAGRWMKFADAVVERGGYSNSVAYAWILNNMGAVHYGEGQYEDALEYWQRSRGIKEKILGPDDPDVARTLGNIALAQYKLGRPTEALALLDRALRIHRLTLGDSHPVLAIELSNRGEILNALGKAQEALLTYDDADEIWLREFGPESAQRAYSLTGAGIALTTLGRSREAEPLLEHALSIRKRADPDAAGLAETEFALASATWTNRPGSVNAVELAQKALEDYRRVPATADKQSAVQTWLAHRSRSARAPSTSAKR
jgi:tetratricopeptide (TPR) repeat protein/tRNA A-37 threonylcarbamoyl transferase component Bud32